MSESLAVSGPVATPRTGTPGRIAALDTRRKLQLALAVLWLLDGILQYQPSMFSHSFPQLLAGGAQGNPAIVAGPISWSANVIGHHLAALNAVFATIQLALGLGIAWRPAVKVALAASVAWSLGVWWFGEGLGGVLAGKASPVNGAPGAVILYALLAILLWPAERDAAAPFAAARAVGRRAAQASWLVLWGSLAFFAWPWPAGGGGRPNSTPTARTWSWASRWPGCSSRACTPSRPVCGKGSSRPARPGSAARRSARAARPRRQVRGAACTQPPT